jgi:hypothetical protein
MGRSHATLRGVGRAVGRIWAGVRGMREAMRGRDRLLHRQLGVARPRQLGVESQQLLLRDVAHRGPHGACVAGLCCADT